MDSYDLRYHVPDALLRKVLVMPLEKPNIPVQIAKGAAVSVVIVAVLFALDWLAFSDPVFVPLSVGLLLGGIALAVSTRLSLNSIMKIHSDFNDTGGECRFAASAEGIISARPGIESHIDWSFVRKINPIDDAVLVQFPTDRIIIPDIALPDGGKAAFVAQLNAWKSA